jgi:hypothetical protein
LYPAVAERKNVRGRARKSHHRGPQAARLPIDTGTFKYAPPSRKPVRISGDGFRDAKNNLWEWEKGLGLGQCEHWNVQHSDSTHSNITPNGEKHHGSLHAERF